MVRILGHLAACACEVTLLTSQPTVTGLTALTLFGLTVSAAVAANGILNELRTARAEDDFATFAARLRDGPIRRG